MRKSPIYLQNPKNDEPKEEEDEDDDDGVGNQHQTFNASKYAGNSKFCGFPLQNMYRDDESSLVPPSTDHGKGYTNEEDEDIFVTMGFYVSVVPGFAIGTRGFHDMQTLVLKFAMMYKFFFAIIGEAMLSTTFSLDECILATQLKKYCFNAISEGYSKVLVIFGKRKYISVFFDIAVCWQSYSVFFDIGSGHTDTLRTLHQGLRLQAQVTTFSTPVTIATPKIKYTKWS
ncbi:hypothetical protein LguiA_012930 [Lonicera macranthoides]